MVPEELFTESTTYDCDIKVTSFRFSSPKIEYCVVITLSFDNTCSTSWKVWRPFSRFVSLDAQLRLRNPLFMKDIIFPKKHRRRSVLGLHRNISFLENRLSDLQLYMCNVTKSSDITSFHPVTLKSQHLKTFIGFVTGFGSNPVITSSRRNHLHLTIPVDIETQRSQMEDQLLAQDLVGIDMPPDGSCFLHCLVYELYQSHLISSSTTDSYDKRFTTVNVGATDGKAPRRMSAARQLRKTLGDFGLENVEKLSTFLKTSKEELRSRYMRFKHTKDEQATVAELYAASSMFNIEIRLITNDPEFSIEPIVPVVESSPLLKVRQKIVLGYLLPNTSAGVAGHYICTQDYTRASVWRQNSFAQGHYRSSSSSLGRSSSTTTTTKRHPSSVHNRVSMIA